MRQGVEVFSLDASGFLTKYRAGEVLPNDYYQTEGMKGWDFASKCHLITGAAAPALPEPQAPKPMMPQRGFGLSNPTTSNSIPPNFGGGGRGNSSAANTGSYGQHQSQSAYSPAQPTFSTPQGRPGSPDRCPGCNSKTIRTARAIYLVGTRDSTGGGTSFGWGRRSSPRSWVSQRTSRSRLAQSMAPPGQTMRTSTMYIAGLVILALVTVVTIVGPILCLWGIHKISKSGMVQREEAEEARLEREYDRTWYCSKCASVFVW